MTVKSEKRKRYALTMPPIKKIFSYDTLRTFRLHITQQIAIEWWDIDPTGLTHTQLCERIVEKQEEEHA